MKALVSNQARHPPSSVNRALQLAKRFAARRVPGSAFEARERGRLQVIAEKLATCPPDVVGAYHEAEQGVTLAWRGIYVPDVQDAWVYAAVAVMLRPLAVEARPVD